MATKCITPARGGGARAMGAPVDRSVAALAGRQHGYVTRPQLLALGLGAHSIKHRVATGRLIPVYNGVYAVGHAPVAAIDRAAAAVLACGPGAALSHGSAASLWGFFKRWTMPFEVTAECVHRRRGIAAHRSTTLSRKDLRRHLGIRVTSPARTLLDIAPRLSDRALTRAVNDARLSRYLNLSDLAELLDRSPGHHGATRLWPFVRAPNGPTRSDFEDMFLSFAQRFGLPVPKLNAVVGGYEVDALFEAEKVIVELDSWEHHSSRNAFTKDRERDINNLLAGFVTVRITWERLTGAPRSEARKLLAILAGRRHVA